MRISIMMECPRCGKDCKKIYNDTGTCVKCRNLIIGNDVIGGREQYGCHEDRS